MIRAVSNISPQPMQLLSKMGGGMRSSSSSSSKSFIFCHAWSSSGMGRSFNRLLMFSSYGCRSFMYVLCVVVESSAQTFSCFTQVPFAGSFTDVQQFSYFTVIKSFDHIQVKYSL